MGVLHIHAYFMEKMPSSVVLLVKYAEYLLHNWLHE